MAKSLWVRPMFDAIAPRYDVLNRLMSAGMDRGWRRFAVAQAMRGHPAKVLDVGAGTCDLGLEIGRTATSNPQVIAVDFAGRMLSRGMERVRQDSANVRAVKGDALNLPVASSSFDAVISAFVLRNLDSLDQAWANFARVLRPGGMLVVLEMTPLRNPFVRRVFRIYFHRWVPWIGRQLSGHAEAYRWLPQSVDQFPPAETIARQIESAGFDGVVVHRLGFGTIAVHVACRK